MRNKIKMFLISLAVFVFGFFLVGNVNADSCIRGDCKATCSATEEPSTSPGDTCTDAYNTCCIPKAIDNPVPNPAPTTPTSCADLFPGAPCFDSRGKPGECSGGACSVPTTSGGNPITGSQPAGSGWNSDDLAVFNLPEASAYEIITNILDWILTIVGTLAIIALVISGIQYYLVATDEKMMETAKKTMRSAIIGLVVALSGFIVIQAVDTMLNAGYLF